MLLTIWALLSDSVRLGGVFTNCFHLAEDTIEWRQTVLDILCAHIRRTTCEKEYQDKYQQEPSEEIQSILTLLFVQETRVIQRPSEQTWKEPG